MEKDVNVSIKSSQIIDNDKNTIEFITNGKMKFSQNNCIVEYYEADDCGLDGSNTVLNIDSEKLVMKRDGLNSTMLILQKGQRHLCPYTTPAGTMTLGINTYDFKNSIDENGGSLTVKYDIEFNHQVSSKNKFEIEIKENICEKFN